MTVDIADKSHSIISHLKSIYSSRVNRLDEIGSRGRIGSFVILDASMRVWLSSPRYRIESPEFICTRLPADSFVIRTALDAARARNTFSRGYSQRYLITGFNCFLEYLFPAKALGMWD